MNEHPTPPPSPPRRIVVLQTTADILNETTSIISTNNLLMFLLLCFYYLSQCFHVEFTALSLISYIDNQPSIKSYFSPIPNSTTIRRRFLTTPQHDDFFDHRFFSTTSLTNPQSNATSLILNPQFGFANFVSDNGIRASETIRSDSKFTFKSIQNDIVPDEINVSVSINQTHDFTALYPFRYFTFSYGILMVGFLYAQSFVHGVIFVLVLNEFCRKRHNHNNNSFLVNFFYACSLGRIRSFHFMFMRLIVRYIFTLFLGLWFFRGIGDKYSLLKIVVRLILMPYSIFTPWVQGFEEESQGFVSTWLLVDLFVSLVLTLDPWILMGDPRKNVAQVVREGWRLLSLMNRPAYNLKGLENIVCGACARLVIARAFGDLVAIAFQAFMEVYFLVAWLLYYLSVKSIDANSSGQPFGQPELEAMLEDVR